MEAGRRLDAEIAEKIMGWRNFHTHHFDGMLTGTTPRDEAWTEVPFYSTDIAAAWQVVEKLQYYDAHYQQGHHFWRFITPEWGRIEYSAHTSAPMAICLAALKAIGEPVTSP
jgi:hypothetical protein